MLINKDPQHELTAALDLAGLVPAGHATLYRYSEAAPGAITRSPLALDDGRLTLPATSISLLVIEGK
jgi:hypothetical protein